jgi:hypothetical protein
MTAKRKFTISGPGAADFLASPGGEDLPGASAPEGTSQTRDESLTGDARNFEPAFGSDDRDDAAARTRRSAADQRTGSQTGTIGGGGADAHNPDPVRATGVDDPTVTGSKAAKKKTTKKY